MKQTKCLTRKINKDRMNVSCPKLDFSNKLNKDYYFIVQNFDLLEHNKDYEHPSDNSDLEKRFRKLFKKCIV